jgi:uncharacterized protein YraI
MKSNKNGAREKRVLKWKYWKVNGRDDDDESGSNRRRRTWNQSVAVVERVESELWDFRERKKKWGRERERKREALSSNRREQRHNPKTK